MKVIIVIELRNREYDNALLLERELVDRGYDVEIAEKTLMHKYKFSEAVLIIPNCYNTENFNYYNYKLNMRNNFVINLQIEQVISKNSEVNGFFNPSGKAIGAHHLCWGENNYQRLLDAGIDKNHLHVVGATQLDFLREEFKVFWYSKSEISEIFNLPREKKWLLYISSFSYVNNADVIKTIQEDFGGEINSSFLNEFEVISTNSQKMTVEWFEKLIIEKPDIVIIYRPHPAETNSDNIAELASRYPQNFKCISQLNIKQWILVSDEILTWFSTSIVESFFAKKMCRIIRPIAVPFEIDCPIYHGAKDVIKTYDELISALEDIGEVDFPISPTKINQYYDVDTRPTFLKIADLVDTLSNSSKYTVEEHYQLNRLKYNIRHLTDVKIFYKNLYMVWYTWTGVRVRNLNLRKKWSFDFLENLVKTKKAHKKDIQTKKSKLDEIRGIYGSK